MGSEDNWAEKGPRGPAHVEALQDVVKTLAFMHREWGGGAGGAVF